MRNLHEIEADKKSQRDKDIEAARGIKSGITYGLYKFGEKRTIELLAMLHDQVHGNRLATKSRRREVARSKPSIVEYDGGWHDKADSSRK